MRYGLAPVFFCFGWLSYGAVSGVQVGDAARQQGILTFRVNDPAQCTVTVYRDAAFTDKVEDTDNRVFAGSESCARPFNILEGNRVTAVVGRRTSELALDGKLHSRSLEVQRTYYAVIVDLTDRNRATASFTTENIPWGDTHVEEVPFSAEGFNHWAYPQLDWSDSGAKKSYVDPVSGVSFRRVVRNLYGEGGPGDNPDAEYPFMGVVDEEAAWTDSAEALNKSAAGPFASYAGTKRSPLFLAFRYDQNAAAAWNIENMQWEDARLNLYGYAARTGNIEDSKVLVCLGVNYNPATHQCAPELEVTLPAQAGVVKAPGSYPAFPFQGWNRGRALTSEDASVPSGKAAVVNSAVTLSSGFLPLYAAPGMKVNIAGTWYTLGALRTATKFTLAEAGVNTSGDWYLGTFGVRIRKKTEAGNAIHVAATYSYVYGYNPVMPPNGSRDFCSSLNFPVGYEADGKTPLNPPKKGRLCMTGTGYRYLFLLLEDGDTRFLSTLFHTDNSWGAGMNLQIPIGSFSTTDPYSLIAVHTDDSGAAGAPERANMVFYKATYDYGKCKFAAWPGNGYHRQNADPCMQWRNQNPYTGGHTITQQISAVVRQSPIWDPSWPVRFQLGGMSGNYAVLSQYSTAQNSPCFVAVFEMTKFTLVKFFDSFSGMLPGFRWAGCHSAGLEMADGLNHASIGFSLLPRDGSGYLSGPFRLQAVTAKSVNGTVWTADTSMTHVLAGACGPNAYGIRGKQCVWVKIQSDRPCNMRADATDATRWPCPWHPGWSSPMSLEAGDYMSVMANATEVDGKKEKFRILSKTADGAGGWILMLQRWAACDNINSDPRADPPAVEYYDHLRTGQGGSTHPNGWLGWMTASGACSGASVWIDLAAPLAQTTWKADASKITADHNTIGLAPDGRRRLQVGQGASRSGEIPAMTGKPADVNFETQVNSFGGITRPAGLGVLEQYPSLSNWRAPTVERRGLYWDFRHINPDSGTSPEDPRKVWNQRYQLVSGQQFTYKLDIYQDLHNHKQRPPNVFGTRGAFRDISGPGAVIDDSKPFSYCYAYKANECRPGAQAGDLYVVAVNAHIEYGGCVSDTYKFYTPCATPLWSQAGWMIEGDTQREDPLGTRFRRISMGLSGPAAQYQYTSPHMVPDSSFALLRAGYAGGVHPDLLAVKMPPPAPTDSIDRSNYVPVAVELGRGSGYIRMRFGYAENGPADKFYCTTRQEACLTDARVKPFVYAQSDKATAIDCRKGCVVNIPGLSGRVVYYRVERSADGSTGWVSGPLQVKAVK